MYVYENDHQVTVLVREILMFVTMHAEVMLELAGVLNFCCVLMDASLFKTILV